MTPGRFHKKAGDAKFRFYHSFVPVLMSLAAESGRSRAKSVHLYFVTPDDSAIRFV